MATRFRAATFAAVLLCTLPAFDPLSRRAYVVYAGSATVDALDLRNPH